jgi:hypothetical protein
LTAVPIAASALLRSVWTPEDIVLSCVTSAWPAATALPWATLSSGVVASVCSALEKALSVSGRELALLTWPKRFWMLW